MKKSRLRLLTPKSLFRGLARELSLLAPTYARLHLAHPALSAYPTLAGLLAHLVAGPHDDAKKHLLAAIVAIRQSSPHRLWVAILLRAFRPMLATLWKKLFGADRQERLAVLLFAFQEALARVDARRDPVRVAMYLRQATRRRAIVALTREVLWDEVGFGDDADDLAGPDTSDARAEQIQAIHALLRRGALGAHVRRRHPALSPEEQTRLYQKLRRGLRKAASRLAPEVTL